jgi:hypothetical protein
MGVGISEIQNMNKSEPNYLWMSFCDPDMPRGKNFLGVIIADTDDIDVAIQVTHHLGINPGGEVLTVPISSSSIMKEHLYVLMSHDDLVKNGYIKRKGSTYGEVLRKLKKRSN